MKTYKLYLVEYEPCQPSKLFRQDEMSFEHFKIHHPVACFVKGKTKYGWECCHKSYGLIRDILYKKMTQEEYDKYDTITEMASYTYSSRF